MRFGRSWLLGHLGDLNTSDYRRRVAQLNHSAAAKAGEDFDQDEQIRALLRENHELKLYLAGLLQLLVRKGTVEARELHDLVEAVERAVTESEQAAAETTSPDLEALAAAARQAEGNEQT